MPADSGASAPSHALKPALVVAAIGIVFGDIATSPLYALQEAFGKHGVSPTAANVLGVLSLTFWSLVLVVSLKYVFFIMRADNKGEGGIMALLALARRALKDRPRLRAAAITTGLLGAALFFGDSVITPAISVLSAVEGLKVAAPALERWIVPVAALILVGLFLVQKHGTHLVGKWFGPVMTLWLLSIGALGLTSLLQQPQILTALNPQHAVAFFFRNGFAGFTTLGATVLVLTGAEALYADMGHFGARPIRVAWTTIALPCLLLSYFGQGALMVADPAAAAGPFYRMVPTLLLYPMILLATAATVIASQAVMTGAYSMIREGMQLGYLPRMRVLQTSDEVRGQVYLPAVNALLFVLVMAATFGFGSSSALAASFGIAVSGTMLMTTLLALVVARLQWHWPVWAVAALGAVMLMIDLAFLGANLAKIASGGWFPLALGTVVFVVMVTWAQGRRLLIARIAEGGVALEPFVDALMAHPPTRVPGTAVFLTTDPDSAPQALLHNLKHNRVLHERNVVLTVDALDDAYVESAERLVIEPLAHDFFRIRVRYGFAEEPDLPDALDACAIRGLGFELMHTTFFTSRENVISGRRPGMAPWRDHLFAFLARNSMAATAFYRIPDNRLIEIGTRVAI